MKFAGVTFGLVIGASLGMIFSNIDAKIFIEYFQEKFFGILLVVLFLIALLLILYVFQERITKFIFGVAASNTKNTIDEVSLLADAYLSGDKHEAKNKSLSIAREIVGIYGSWTVRAWAFKALFSLIIIMAGLFGTYVLIEQNKLLGKQLIAITVQTEKLTDQNALISAQNERIEEQNKLTSAQYKSNILQLFLQESTRRTALTPTVTQIISEINLVERDITSSNLVTIPSDLRRRITSLLPILKPYTIVEVKTGNLNLNEPLENNAEILYLSPERGQILQALINKGANFSVFGPADFTYADMRNFSFNWASISNIGSFDCAMSEDIVKSHFSFENLRLDYSNFTDANLLYVAIDLSSNMVLDGADIYGSYVNLIGSQVSKTLGKISLSDSFVNVLSTTDVKLKNIEIYNFQQDCFRIEASARDGFVRDTDDVEPDLSGMRIFISTFNDIEEDKLMDFIFDDYIIDETTTQKSKYKASIDLAPHPNEDLSIVTLR